MAGRGACTFFFFCFPAHPKAIAPYGPHVTDELYRTFVFLERKKPAQQKKAEQKARTRIVEAPSHYDRLDLIRLSFPRGSSLYDRTYIYVGDDAGKWHQHHREWEPHVM